MAAGGLNLILPLRSVCEFLFPRINVRICQRNLDGWTACCWCCGVNVVTNPTMIGDIEKTREILNETADNTMECCLDVILMIAARTMR